LKQDLRNAKTSNANGDKNDVMERKLLDLENTIKNLAANN
jgi:hypothetical protein